MKIENVVIIGSGPAAFTAALFVSSESPVLFEGEFGDEIGPGGQLTITTNIDNYPGFPNGINGPELMETMKKQAEDKDIRIISRKVVKVEKKNEIFLVIDSNGDKYETRSIIIGTGASARRISVPGTNEGEYWQKGISACVVCDGYIYRNKIVALIGGGDSAMEESIYMSNIAKKVYLIHRRNKFRARNDKQEELKKRENINILTPYELVRAEGNEKLRKIVIVNKENEKNEELEVDGLFFAIGHVPNTNFLEKFVDLNENKYIITDENMKTSVEGIFACGDVQDYKYKQAVTAAASGCIAGKECLNYLLYLKNNKLNKR